LLGLTFRLSFEEMRFMRPPPVPSSLLLLSSPTRRTSPVLLAPLFPPPSTRCSLLREFSGLAVPGNQHIFLTGSPPARGRVKVFTAVPAPSTAEYFTLNSLFFFLLDFLLCFCSSACFSNVVSRLDIPSFDSQRLVVPSVSPFHFLFIFPLWFC